RGGQSGRVGVDEQSTPTRSAGHDPQISIWGRQRSTAASSGERRLLPSLTILALIVIPFLLPEHLRSWTFIVLGGLETALLIAIVIVDPGRVDAVGALVRGLSIALTLLLVAAATLATVDVVIDLLDGAPE